MSICKTKVLKKKNVDSKDPAHDVSEGNKDTLGNQTTAHSHNILALHLASTCQMMDERKVQINVVICWRNLFKENYL